MSSYDVIVLGSGPGGYVAAIRAAQNGLKTAIVEGDALGGVCLNWGCIPTKALIESATLLQSIPDLERFGIKADRSGFSYPTIHKESRSASEKLSRGVQYLLKTNGVEIIRGYGSISASRHVRLASTGKELEGSSIIIATGSREKEVPGFPFDGTTIVSSKDMLACTALPKDIARYLGRGLSALNFSYLLAAFVFLHVV